MQTNRRGFLSDVGRGALIASLGPSLVGELGLSNCLAAEEQQARLTFGGIEPLVSLMEDTPIDQFLPKVVAEIKRGTAASKLVAASALANARALGGQDYVGYHALMALAPAFSMAGKNPTDKQWLPILKVLYRNTNQIQSKGGKDHELLHLVDATTDGKVLTGEELRSLIRDCKMEESEAAFARMVSKDAKDAFNALQLAIQDDINVHRVVLVWRAWALLPLTGMENAHTMLRQSVRFCVDGEQYRASKNQPEPEVRKVIPKLIDQYKLAGLIPGNRTAEDAWIDRLAGTIHMGTRDQAAEAAAAALAEGFSPAAVAEAICVAANRLVLFDPGRPEQWASSNKPAGSCHGDSVGVHASDSANAWRNIANVGDARTAITSMVVGAYHTGGQQRKEGVRFPTPDDVASVRQKSPEDLLRETESAIRGKDQHRVCAVVHRYGELGHAPKPMFDLLRQFAVTEDGALHAEKFYQTATEEFATIRPAFRWGELVALARVTASQFGYPAPGVEEATKLLS